MLNCRVVAAQTGSLKEVSSLFTMAEAGPDGCAPPQDSPHLQMGTRKNVSLLTLPHV